MKVIIGIATMAGREPYLKQALKSLEGQADVIHVYNNAIEPIDLTDNGKFFFLNKHTEPIYYFSCDDDLIYPPTYVKDMISAIEKHGCIVTHHGRILLGAHRSYYRGHKAFQCLHANSYEGVIHVSGTGVTAFRTDYFNPLHIWKSNDRRMSDLVFSLEACNQGKKIVILPHDKGYINYLNVPVNQTIHGMDSHKEQRQIEIANEIWKAQ